MVDGAQKYQNGAFPTSKIKNHPIDFSKFLVSLVDIKRAAQIGGVYLNQSGKTGWRIIFNSNGTFTAAPCTGSSLEDSPAPTCTPAVTYNVPTNGAIYTDVTAIVSGQVNGRATVGAGQNIVVADAIGPVDGRRRRDRPRCLQRPLGGGVCAGTSSRGRRHCSSRRTRGIRQAVVTEAAA